MPSLFAPPVDMSTFTMPTAAAPLPITASPAGLVPDFNGPRTDGRGNAAWYDTGVKGIGEHISDWLKSPGISGALLRASGAALNGGFGGAVAAGTGYVDQQHAEQTAAAQQQFKNAMDVLRQQVEQQQADQTGTYQRGQLGIDAARVGETINHNRAEEGLTRSGQQVQVYQTDQNNATSLATNAASNASSTANNLRDNSTRTYEANLGFTGANQRALIAAGARTPGWTETKVSTPASSSWFGPSTPASVTTTRAPVVAVAPTPEIRYDAQGRGYRKGPDGKPVLVR